MSNNYHKADLVAFTYQLLAELLNQLFKNYTRNIPDRKRKIVLLYCLIYKAISAKQVYIIMDKKNYKATDMVMRRMVNKGIIKKFIYNRNDEAAYCLTTKGRNESIKLTRQLINFYGMENNLSSDSNVFRIEEVVEELKAISASNQPKYWGHYFASRDIYIYLLSQERIHVEYETEVAIKDGVPVSLYERTLIGSGLRYHLRCDAMIKYNKYSDNKYAFFMELDNGTQNITVLVDKIKKYLLNFVDTSGFAPETALLFLINNNISNVDLYRKNDIKISSREYYYSNELFCVHEMLINSSVKIQEDCTVDEVLSVLRKMIKVGRSTKKLKQLMDFFEAKSNLFSKEMRVCDLNSIYSNTVKRRNKENYKINSNMQKDKYLARRSTIHKAAMAIPGLIDAFLRGFSLFTAANFNLDNTLRYICVKLTDNWAILLAMLYFSGFYKNNELPIMKPYIFLENGRALKNYYYFSYDDLGVIMENVSDDLGGYYRIWSLLNQDDIPESLCNTKVICISDSISLENIKAEFVITKQGKVLANLSSEEIGSGFDILFVIYENIHDKGHFTYLHSD